ncbi:MAG: N-ethylammeline chlorohydrolase, partial [Clostridiales bacterium]|nr:N-ethylammeline chlorohydrolase [Clostridiales bacterium]
MSTIIKNALILTMEESAPVKQGDIVIENGRFAQVGGMAQVKDGDEVIEAGHHVAMPGFVNAHAHSPMTLLRGVGDDLPLDRWLTEAIFPLEANLQDGDCYWGTMAAAAEMIAGGTVLFLEMYQAADEIAKATAESGMRGLITRGVAFRAEDEAAAMGRIKRLE